MTPTSCHTVDNAPSIGATDRPLPIHLCTWQQRQKKNTHRKCNMLYIFHDSRNLSGLTPKPVSALWLDVLLTMPQRTHGKLQCRQHNRLTYDKHTQGTRHHYQVFGTSISFPTETQKFMPRRDRKLWGLERRKLARGLQRVSHYWCQAPPPTNLSPTRFDSPCQRRKAHPTELIIMRVWSYASILGLLTSKTSCVKMASHSQRWPIKDST